jgi:2-polyprenyl-3-methyl-5-hydroxy-6-metoxy-1,4-benzoquinol methylase
MKQQLKRALIAAIGATTNRHAVLLAREASGADAIAAVNAPYRVEGDTLEIGIQEPAPARLRATYVDRGADRWSSGELAYDGPSTLGLAIATGEVTLNGRVLGSVSGGQPVTARRFDWRLELHADGGGVRTRQTSHYVARHGRAGEASYYDGEDYVDYEAESQAVHESIVALARQHEARGPVLEIGCATGGTLAALAAAGLDGIGLDLSEWAVGRAVERLGPGRAFACDVERDPIPGAISAAAPFGLLVMASVFEHFHHPFDIAASLGQLVRPGGLMVIITSNADSLSHRVYGRDWEGYFDWTHHGVDQVRPATLRDRLPAAGWRVRDLHTWHFWDGSSDPTHATLRDLFVADARFRRLLVERDLGDFITCVAERIPVGPVLPDRPGQARS